MLQKSSAWLPKNSHHIVIITDNAVKNYYAGFLTTQLKTRGCQVLVLSFSPGERSKTAKTKQLIEEKMLTAHCGRDTLILALGGGIVGDLAGFVAATYMRGIPIIQLPTTLLAMIDSSVGGKVGINTPQGKNLIGAFWQPSAVITDIDTLKTLPKKQLISGLIEAIKIFLTCDAQEFKYIQENLQLIFSLSPKVLSRIIYQAVKLKADIVRQDEKEQYLRMILNFGHTIGHALEKLSNYKILHGYAVAYGILVEAKIAQLMNILSEQDYLAIKACFQLIGITNKTLQKYSAEDIIATTKIDKKAKAGSVRYVLLEKIGRVYTIKNDYAHRIPEKLIKAAILILQGE